jgi:hypothetical protein
MCYVLVLSVRVRSAAATRGRRGVQMFYLCSARGRRGVWPFLFSVPYAASTTTRRDGGDERGGTHCARQGRPFPRSARGGAYILAYKTPPHRSPETTFTTDTHLLAVEASAQLRTPRIDSPPR